MADGVNSEISRKEGTQSSKQKWDALIEWGHQQGIWCPGWTVQRQPSGDRSALATEQIDEGAVLCRVPRMSAWVVTADEPPKVPASFIDPAYWLSEDMASDRGWFLKLAAKLLYEKHLGNGSKWFPYIQNLPQHVDTLLHWTDEELDELQSERLKVALPTRCRLAHKNISNLYNGNGGMRNTDSIHPHPSVPVALDAAAMQER